MIKANALLNCFHRERLIQYRIKANQEDVEAGFQLYEQVSQANEYGLSPYVSNIYEKVIRPLIDNDDSGIDNKQVTQAYFKIFHKTISHKTLREIYDQLENAGLVLREHDPQDKRKTLIFNPPVSGTKGLPHQKKI